MKRWVQSQLIKQQEKNASNQTKKKTRRGIRKSDSDLDNKQMHQVRNFNF